MIYSRLSRAPLITYSFLSLEMQPWRNSTDSVWVQLATEDNQFGWTRESRLLPKVVPDDPISEFIMTFSNTHLLIFLVIIIIIAVAYTVRRIFHSNGKLVHFNDIDSPYPTALVLIVSISATFYATIQLFLPEVWRHFYFHPTLNPFASLFFLYSFNFLTYGAGTFSAFNISDI